MRGGGRLMYVRCIRSWRVSAHSRQPPISLSSLKGFTLELLEVSNVRMRTAAAGSAWTAVAGSSASYNTLGLLWRSLVITCLFVPRRKRKIYWYVMQPGIDALVE